MGNKGAIITFVAVIIIFLTIVFIGTGFEKQKYEVNISELQGVMLGDSKAPIRIIEWGDFDCQHCADFAINVLPKLKKSYIDEGEVVFIYKHFPREEKTSALKSECAEEQGKFWKYHDALYRGEEIKNLDLNKFETCVNSKKYMGNVNRDLLDGLNLGVRATPTFVINDRIIEGAIPYETFVKIIEQEMIS